MDQSGDELGRLVAFVNRRPWLVESPSSDCSCGPNYRDVQVQCSYFLDKLGTTEFGDSSLHRLLAWHPTPEQLEAFLCRMQLHQASMAMKENDIGDCVMPTNMMDTSMDVDSPAEDDNLCEYQGMPAPPALDQQNQKGVTALHIAVYRNSFHAHALICQLLRREPSLASIPMACGSYPLHILCGHNVTIHQDVLEELLEADPSVVWKEDVNGDTPLSLLWKNVLRFRWAQQDLISLEEDDEDSEEEYHADSSRRRRPSWMTVISPDQFISFSLQMIRAAVQKSHLSLSDVCRMPRCPPLLIQLLLQHYNQLTATKYMLPDVWSSDSEGRTPLHYAAIVDPVTTRFVPANVQTKLQSVLSQLLNMFPSMACAKDHLGRIPLHYVLEKEFYDQEEMIRLVGANPDSLRTKDPVTSLYPFALWASTSKVTTTKTNDTNYCHLDSIFTLLRRFPEAAMYKG